MIDWLRERMGLSPRTGATDESRWLVVDVESSGLNARQDRLLAIAAVALHFEGPGARPGIALADSFEVFIRQPSGNGQEVDKANILLHGIGIGAQRSGIAAPLALQEWRRFVGRSPLVAYHSAFDQTMIDRACQEHLGMRLSNPWLDLEPLAAVLHGEARRRPLDHWIARHRLSCLMRHQAAADTLVTAQLLLALWPMLPARLNGRPPATFKAVQDLADGARFLSGRV